MGLELKVLLIIVPKIKVSRPSITLTLGYFKTDFKSLKSLGKKLNPKVDATLSNDNVTSTSLKKSYLDPFKSNSMLHVINYFFILWNN